MWDVRIARVAGAQFNRVARRQLIELGMSEKAIDHRVGSGRLVVVEDGVYALAPVLAHDHWGRWMAATLTTPDSVLSHASAAAAWEFGPAPRLFETVTRPGDGGPRRHGGVLAFRSSTVAEHATLLAGIPITTPQRTLLDLAAHLRGRGLARAVRDAVRLERTTIGELADAAGRHAGRRGTARLGAVLARYTGLPIERARSGAEVRALEILREAGRPLPRLNVRIAGEEADLSWARLRRIVEIDGRPFHLDAGEDARKQRCWEAAGWMVQRIDASAVYEAPALLLSLAPPNVPPTPL